MMAVTAHPDDESLGFGGTLARYASEGVEVSLVVATRGERGRFGDGQEPHPGESGLGRIREAEVREAAALLGVRHVRFLGYLDGDLDQAPTAEATGRIVSHLRELRPQVVLTFDPFGGYGHPDHIAIGQLTAGAVVAAATGDHGGGDPHQVQKLYYMAWTDRVWSAYQEVFKVLSSTVDGVVRPAVPWPPWSVTTTADAHEHWETVWSAVQCHRSQIAQYARLEELTPEDHKGLWGPQEYYRVFSLVNGGRELERDLFEGLR
jgi:LmbE family N-acetylglucosaminyl deacetylase